MVLIKENTFQELPEFIREQVYRELEMWESLDTSNEKQMKKRLKNVVFGLYEYDPNLPEDLEALNFLLKRKEDEEGKADQHVVDEIGSSGSILDPILIEQDRCCEGRHRISASIKYNLKIKAYIY